MQQLVAELLDGNRRAAARLISLVENDDPQKRELLKDIYPHTGKAYVIGVTGAPGSGKSSLVDWLLKLIRKDGLTVGVIAVDPTSPFSGGAILVTGSACRTTRSIRIFLSAAWEPGAAWVGYPGQPGKRSRF